MQGRGGGGCTNDEEHSGLDHFRCEGGEREFVRGVGGAFGLKRREGEGYARMCGLGVGVQLGGGFRRCLRAACVARPPSQQRQLVVVMGGTVIAAAAAEDCCLRRRGCLRSSACGCGCCLLLLSDDAPPPDDACDS